MLSTAVNVPPCVSVPALVVSVLVVLLCVTVGLQPSPAVPVTAMPLPAVNPAT